MDAGVEGGSRRRIKEEWSLNDVAEQRSYWKRHGPPLKVIAAAMADWMGVKFTSDEPAKPTDELPLQTLGPSIAELAAAAPGVVPGGDTLAASLAVAKRLGGVTDG